MVEYKLIAVGKLKPSSSNPRTRFDDAQINELAESIKSVGLIEPLLVRPLEGGNYEVVCGERRYRASKKAKIKELPCTIRELNDNQAIELQITENLQRQDVNPLDEAVTFQRLIGNKTYSVKDLALRLGKSETYVLGRLKLNNLIDEAKLLLYENIMPITSAFKIAVLDEKQQHKVIDFMVSEITVSDGNRKVFKGADQLRNFLDNHVMINLTESIFDLTDKTLNPEAGACGTCPMRTGGANLSLFNDIVAGDRCLNGTCYNTKLKAHYMQLKEKLEKDNPGVDVVFINRAFHNHGSVIKCDYNMYTVEVLDSKMLKALEYEPYKKIGIYVGKGWNDDESVTHDWIITNTDFTEMQSISSDPDQAKKLKENELAIAKSKKRNELLSMELKQSLRKTPSTDNSGIIDNRNRRILAYFISKMISEEVNSDDWPSIFIEYDLSISFKQGDEIITIDSKNIDEIKDDIYLESHDLFEELLKLSISQLSELCIKCSLYGLLRYQQIHVDSDLIMWYDLMHGDGSFAKLDETVSKEIETLFKKEMKVKSKKKSD